MKDSVAAANKNNQPVDVHPRVPNPNLPANHQNPSVAAKVVLGTNGSLEILAKSIQFKLYTKLK